MPCYEMIIAAVDECDLSSDHKRQKEGDIIAVREHPWYWGKKEVSRHLIVVVQSERMLNGTSLFECLSCRSVKEIENGKWHPVRRTRKFMTGEEGTCHDKKGKWNLLICDTCGSNEWKGKGCVDGMRQIFERRPLFAGGYKETDFRDINLDPTIGQVDKIGLINPKDHFKYVIRLRDQAIMPRPPKLAKHRFRIPLEEIVGLDLDKVRDETCIYQPFKTKMEICKNPSIDGGKVDCVGMGVDKDTNLILSLETTRRIIKDKHDGRSIGANL